MAVLLGVGPADQATDGERLAAKVASLRIFVDALGRLHHTVGEAGGGILVVPQFTLYGDIRQGRRPDFTRAAPPAQGERLYEGFCGALRGAGLEVATGRFGAQMRVRIDADGPVTIVASTDGWAEGDLGRGRSA
ncbi:MAG: D-aminoacyl-tRNA deacylase [Candidatus Limnocylindrales bacterium]